MATSTQQKQELFKSIWAIANELRGSVDGWDFKQYVLGMLFYRYISENITNYINNEQLKAGYPNFDYAAFDDAQAESARASIVAEKGFFILPSQLFCNVRKHAHHDDQLNMTLDKAFKSIEASAIGTDSEDDMKGLFDDLDVNSTKLGSSVDKRNERLARILDAVGDMNLDGPQGNKIDAFGDAYEFLMKMYAGNAGKSGGEYFTPQEVSELLARIATHNKTKVRKVYDPACGSGSLLMQVAKVIGKENVQQGFFGQEINQTTYNLCRINMFLHDINYNHFSIALGDTLLEPQHWDDQPFDVIVSNPPYSIKWKGDDSPVLINDRRFSPAGVLAPKSKADLAFTMHMLSWLATDGAAAIVEFPGVLYRGGAEQKIRQYLIDNNYVDAVIQLPANLFFGVSIATCIIVIRKNKTDNKVLFIDASNEFVHEGNKNKLTSENIQHILDLYANRTGVQYVTSLINNTAISEKDYTLSVNSYVEQKDTHEAIDIDALNEEIRQVVTHENNLRQRIDELIASKLRCMVNGAEWKKLGELGVFENTGVDKKSRDDEQEVTLLNFMDVCRHKYIDASVPTMVVTAPEKKITQCNVLKDDIFITPSSETIGEIGFAAVIMEDLPNVVYSYHIMRYRLNNPNTITAKYIRYLFEAPVIRKQILKEAKGLTRFGLSKYQFAALNIPFPPLEIQRKIVECLDNFSALAAELQAELQKSRKQYEYYRTLLLTPSPTESTANNNDGCN